MNMIEDFEGEIHMRDYFYKMRIEKLEKLTSIKQTKKPRRHLRDMTLIYKHYVKPNEHVSPVVVLPGRHFEYADPLFLQGTDKDNRYVFETYLLSERDKESEWLSKGVRDSKGRIWFVDA
jgi:hypothetical protein